MCPWPSTSSVVPETNSQTRLQKRMIRSIHGLVSFTNATAMTSPAQMTVIKTPIDQVMTDLSPMAIHRIAPSVAGGVSGSRAGDPARTGAFTLGAMDKDAIRAEVRSDGPIEIRVQDDVVSCLFSWMSSRLPGTVAAFLAMPGEIDLSPLFDRLPGWRWVLPRVEDRRRLSFRDRDVPREVHRFGMTQPIDQGPEIPIIEIDLFLTPGLGFDLRGGRVGNGAGYYDRVLAAKRRDAQAMGVTIDRRVFDRVPMFEHDQRMDWLATESGVRECLPTR